MWKRSVVQKKHTVKKTIPFVQKWYQGTDHQLFHQEIYGNDAGSNLTCVWILSLTSLKRSSKVVIQKSKVCAACFGKCCVGILEESTNLGRSWRYSYPSRTWRSHFVLCRSSGLCLRKLFFFDHCKCLKENLRFDLGETEMKIICEYTNASSIAVILDRWRWRWKRVYRFYMSLLMRCWIHEEERLR